MGSLSWACDKGNRIRSRAASTLNLNDKFSDLAPHHRLLELHIFQPSSLLSGNSATIRHGSLLFRSTVSLRTLSIGPSLLLWTMATEIRGTRLWI